jgi:L-malate glycosyltransferase
MPDPDKLSITFVLPAYPRDPSGGTRIVFELCNRLANRGHRVHIVSTRERRRPGRVDRSIGSMALRHARSAAGRFRDHYLWDKRIDWTPVNPRVELTFVPRLSAAHVPDADVVIATAWWTMRYVDAYPSDKGRKYYLIQNYEIWDGPSPLVDATWRMPARKIVIASWLHQKALELGVDPEEITHVPYGMNFHRFGLTARPEARPPRVAMLYHPDPRKRASVGIAALEIARTERPDLSAVLFGTCKRPRGLPPWIDYRRAPSDLPALYNGSAIYLCPSSIEGWHLPAAEAMACSCALVSTDIPGVHDYARHGETARLVAVDDSRSMATEIVSLLAHPEERTRLAMAGQDEIAGYEWDRSVDRLEAWLGLA